MGRMAKSAAFGNCVTGKNTQAKNVMAWYWTIWLALALLLCWVVGAYNRLVRLRAAALAAFAALDAQWSHQLELIQDSLGSAGASPLATHDALQAKVQGAASQFSSALVHARAQPLNGAAIGALEAARDILNMVWQQQAAPDAPGSVPPDFLQAHWARVSLQTLQAREAFSQAVAHYNAAISQCPACLVAWAFSFQRARSV